MTVTAVAGRSGHVFPGGMCRWAASVVCWLRLSPCPPPAPGPQVVYGHLDDPESQEIQRGVTYLNLRPGGCCTARPASCMCWAWLGGCRASCLVHAHRCGGRWTWVAAGPNC